MWWWTAAALAADPSPGLLLPSAGPAEAGDVEVAVVGGHVGLDLLGTTTVGGGGGLRASWAPTDRWWFEVSGGALAGETRTCALLIVGTGGGGCSDPETWVGGASSIAGRVLLARSPGFGLAAIGGLAGGADEDGLFGVGVLGLAVEGGSERVRVDLSMTGAIWQAEDEPHPWLLPVGEGGVSLLLGTEARHRLRFGLAELAPDASWRYDADRWFVGAGVTGLPVLAGAERLEVGARFR
ncbi:MAG: hypothetical protein KC656_02095 [Myxococcales bacterium]|nr:hypothetical protein [Myxococcales bacterium]MCA9566596.1 hypothetical protein [Myxococcales bacterium]